MFKFKNRFKEYQSNKKQAGWTPGTPKPADIMATVPFVYENIFEIEVSKL